MPDGRLTILVVGGYGIFGGRLVDLLADEARLTLIVAGRSIGKAQEFCNARQSAAAALVAARLDRNGDVDPPLLEMQPNVLVDASGPFQVYGDDPYRLLKACLARGVNYLDFADDSGFARGIVAFDSEAKQRGLFALSAASSCPALSGAAIRELARGVASVDRIDGGIAPSAFAGIGPNVVRAITSYAGQPIALTRNGKATVAYGLTESRRFAIAPPGRLPLRSRRFVLADVPDLQLIPEIMPGLQSMWFGAATEPAIYLRILSLLAWLVRLRLFPKLTPFAGLFHTIGNRFTWGEHRGGMFVRLCGRTASGGKISRSWHLLAEGDAGPSVPSMAIDAIIRKWLGGEPPEPGARTAVAELSLADFERGFTAKSIVTGIRDEQAAGEPLYRRILGSAWGRLPEPIRELHTVETSKKFSGRARVDRGTGVIARLIGAFYRFPDAGSQIPVDVLLERRGDGELWQRSFAGRVFRSWQREGRGRSQQLIDERFGPVSVGLALVEEDGRLEYIVRCWTLLGIPMPAFMAPSGRTFEFVEDGHFHFHVEIAHPWFGLIVRYQGWLEETGR